MTAEANDLELLPITDFVIPQSKDAFCDHMRQLVGIPICRFTFHKNGLLVRKLTLNGSIQNLVTISLRQSILYLAHHSTLADHSDKLQMYNSLRREYYRPNMEADIYNTVRSCTACPRMGTKSRHEPKRKLFPPSGPSEFVGIDLLGPLPRTRFGNQFVFIITERYSNLT